MRLVYLILICFIVIMSCGGGGSPMPSNTPVDNMCIIEFYQPAIYEDNTTMDSTPDREVAGYYLYVCNVIDGTVGKLIWVAEINNPLRWEMDAWRGVWDIRNLLIDNTSIINGATPNGTIAFSLKAVSTRINEQGKPFISAFSIPWVYGDPSIPLDNQILQEGDIYASDFSVNSPIVMDFSVGSGN